jgi:hypothetical protein
LTLIGTFCSLEFLFARILIALILFTIAQSFSTFLEQDGWQVRRPSWIWVTSLCYILLNKFVALVGSGRQVRRPSCDEKGLKDWAIKVLKRTYFFPSPTFTDRRSHLAL